MVIKRDEDNLHILTKNDLQDTVSGKKQGREQFLQRAAFSVTGGRNTYTYIYTHIHICLCFQQGAQ